MDRRSGGFVLVAVVIIAAVIWPVWGGRRVPGVGVLAPPPGPAQVGDCLHTLPSVRSALDYLPPLLAARTTPCDGESLGEVVEVTNDVGSFPRTTSNGLSRPNALACDAPLRQYLGWPALDTQTQTGAWRPWSTVSAGLIGPDLQQYFAGQRWIACVAYPQFAPFQGSIRDSVILGGAALSYATCMPVTTVAQLELVSCAQPHQTELFGWSVDRLPVDDHIAVSCSQLVQRLTGIDDPTAGGALRVAVQEFTHEGTGSDGMSSPGLVDRLVCSVTVAGPRRLVGTLIGLGDRELPWE